MAQKLALSIWIYSFAIGSFFMFFFTFLDIFFKINFFEKFFQEYYQSVNVLSGLIWVQTVCKSYQQTSPGYKELKDMLIWTGTLYTLVVIIYYISMLHYVNIPIDAKIDNFQKKDRYVFYFC